MEDDSSSRLMRAFFLCQLIVEPRFFRSQQAQDGNRFPLQTSIEKGNSGARGVLLTLRTLASARQRTAPLLTPVGSPITMLIVIATVYSFRI